MKEQQEVPAAACLCDRRERDSPHRRAWDFFPSLGPQSLSLASLVCRSVGNTPASNPELCSQTRGNETRPFLPVGQVPQTLADPQEPVCADPS